MVSGSGAEDPPAGDEVWEIYLRAKAEADAALAASDREWTIVRPGGCLLSDSRSAGRILYVNSGEQSIEQAREATLGGAG